MSANAFKSRGYSHELGWECLSRRAITSGIAALSLLALSILSISPVAHMDCVTLSLLHPTPIQVKHSARISVVIRGIFHFTHETPTFGQLYPRAFNYPHYTRSCCSCGTWAISLISAAVNRHTKAIPVRLNQVRLLGHNPRSTDDAFVGCHALSLRCSLSVKAEVWCI